MIKNAVIEMLPVYVLSFVANLVSAIVILCYGMPYSDLWGFLYKRVFFIILSVVTSLLICIRSTQTVIAQEGDTYDEQD